MKNKFKYLTGSITELIMFWLFLNMFSFLNGLNYDFIDNLITKVSAKFMFSYMFFCLLMDLYFIIKRRNS